MMRWLFLIASVVGAIFVFYLAADIAGFGREWNLPLSERTPGILFEILLGCGLLTLGIVSFTETK